MDGRGLRLDDAPMTSPSVSDPTVQAPSGEAPPEPRPARLRRSHDERVLGGVAGGIAEHFAIDPVLVRLAFVVGTFLAGVGVVAYLIAWIAIPAEAEVTPSRSRPPVDVRQLLGFGLVALGLAVIPGRVGIGVDGDVVWPLGLMMIGASVLWLRTRDGGEPAANPALETHASPEPPPVPVAPEPVEDPTAPTAPLASVASERPRRGARRASRGPRSRLGRLVMSALLVVLGAAWLLDLMDAVELDVGAITALVLTVLGAGLVAGAWFGRARGLIALGAVVAFALGGIGLLDVPLRGGIGDPVYRPRSAAAVRSRYELAIGKLVVDLRGVTLTESRRVRATVGIGDLEVLVAPGARVDVSGRAGAGVVTVFGRRTHTCCPAVAHRSRPGSSEGGRLVLVAKVGVGEVRVLHREEVLRGPS